MHSKLFQVDMNVINAKAKTADSTETPVIAVIAVTVSVLKVWVQTC